MRLMRILEEAEYRVRRLGERLDEDALRWNLYAAVQNIIDALAIVFSEMGWVKPPSYAQLASEAFRRGLVPDIARLVRLRNRLAHAYREMGPEELEEMRRMVVSDVPRAIESLRTFAEKSGVDPVEEGWERLAPVFERHGVLFAYLFGSRARGLARADSDWDFAVYFGREVTALDETELEEDLEEVLGAPVDVVALDRAPLDLVYVVLRDGRPVYSRDERARRSWEVEAYLEYLDYEELVSALWQRARKRRA